MLKSDRISCTKYRKDHENTTKVVWYFIRKYVNNRIRYRIRI